MDQRLDVPHMGVGVASPEPDSASGQPFEDENVKERRCTCGSRLTSSGNEVQPLHEERWSQAGDPAEPIG